MQDQERCLSSQTWVHHHVMLARCLSPRVWVDLSVKVNLALAPSNSNSLKPRRKGDIPGVAFKVRSGLTPAGQKDMLVL